MGGCFALTAGVCSNAGDSVPEPDCDDPRVSANAAPAVTWAERAVSRESTRSSNASADRSEDAPKVARQYVSQPTVNLHPNGLPSAAAQGGTFVQLPPDGVYGYRGHAQSAGASMSVP